MPLKAKDAAVTLVSREELKFKSCAIFFIGILGEIFVLIFVSVRQGHWQFNN